MVMGQNSRRKTNSLPPKSEISQAQRRAQNTLSECLTEATLTQARLNLSSLYFFCFIYFNSESYKNLSILYGYTK